MKLICKECWIEFESDRSNKKYCSRLCYTKNQKWKPLKVNLLWKRGNKPFTQVKKICTICWKEYMMVLWRSKTSKYCSKECWSKRNPKIQKDCIYCWKEFWSYISSNKTYCSDKCKWLHLRELKKWENSPFWKWGITKQNKLDRTRAIYLEWRQKIFERDNYTCKDCWIRSGNWKKVYLQAHHKKWFADYPENRYDVDNGINLCKDCHLLRHHHKF